VSRHGHAFIDRALYLPKGWTADPARLKATYVPGDIAFSTKPAQEFVVLGTDKFLDRQLHPSIEGQLSKEAQDRIDELSISHTPMERFVADMDQELKTANSVSDPKQKQHAQKAYQDSLSRYGREPAVRSIQRYWVLGGSVKGSRIVGDQIKVEQKTLFQSRDYRC
jgi:hypothetical protein